MRILIELGTDQAFEKKKHEPDSDPAIKKKKQSCYDRQENPDLTLKKSQFRILPNVDPQKIRGSWSDLILKSGSDQNIRIRRLIHSKYKRFKLYLHLLEFVLRSYSKVSYLFCTFNLSLWHFVQKMWFLIPYICTFLGYIRY